MNLQLLRHGIRTRAASKAASFLLTVWMVGAGLGAGAQVATRTRLAVASEAHRTTFTAQVGDVAGNPATSGTVSFAAAAGSLGSAFVQNGEAVLTLDKLPQGTRTVTAAYSGSEGYAASASGMSANADASGTLPDFSLTASPTSVSLSPGDYANITVTVTPENGFNDTVTLSCSGVPATAKCLFSPATLTPFTTAPVSSTLQIQTQAASGTSTALAHSPSSIAYAILLPGILALAGLGALRKQSGIATLRVVGFMALLIAGGLGLGACSQRYGYLNHPPSGNPGTEPGSYNITVSGYASISGTSVTGHSLNIALTVK